MCKYCELKTVNEKLGEKINDSAALGQIYDGSQAFEAYLWRYVVEFNGTNESYIELELAVDINDKLMTVKNTIIPITYCPFCGEKL